MKKILTLALVCINLMSSTYQGILEPKNRKFISSEISGIIIYSDKNNELKKINGNLFKIDSSLEKKQLENLKNKRKIMYKILKIKNDNFKKISKLKGKSYMEKENAEVDVLNTKNSINDINYQINTLIDTIKKKNINVNNLYIKEILVTNGEYVTPGKNLANVEDVSSSKIILYIDKVDMDKKFIIPKKYKCKLIKKSISTDKKYLSQYKIEFKCKYNKSFGDIINITTMEN